MGSVDLNQVIELLKALQAGNATVGKKVNVAAGTGSPAGILGGYFTCADATDIISAVVPEENLSAWAGAMPATDQQKIIPMLAWVGPSGTSAGSVTWGRSSDCENCVSVEWGDCHRVFCFGEVCASGQDFKITDARTKAYASQPVYRVQGPLAGTPVTDMQQFQLALAAGVIRQQLMRQMIQGNKTVRPLESDGLMVLINSPLVDAITGNRCQAIEPIVYDWNSAAMTGTICDVLSAIVRRIRNRAQPLGGLARGDMVLLMTPTMRDALLDFAACGCGPCGSVTSVDIGGSLAARDERARLMQGGLFGDGMFEVDGAPVDIITTSYIPETQGSGTFCSDVFVLTRRAGTIPALWVEYKDYTQTMPADLMQFPDFSILDGGRFVRWTQKVNDCVNQTLKSEWRWVVQAPWLQARITDVCAPFTLEPESNVPGDTYFRAGSTPSKASELETYLYGSAC